MRGGGRVAKELAVLSGFSALLITCAIRPSASGTDISPLWLSDKDAVYPAEKYLAELGEGDSLSAARANAAGAIAQIFRLKVEVDNVIRTRYTEITGNKGELLELLSQTDFDQEIGQEADETFVNLKYGESWIDQAGRVYTIAYLNRLETGNLYRKRIERNNYRIAELLDRAEGQHEPLRRYAFLDSALVYAGVNQILFEQLEIINMPMAQMLGTPYSRSEIQAIRADQAIELKILVEVAGDTDGRIANALENWITERGFVSSSSGDMFLAAAVEIEPLELQNKYVNLNWTINIALIDMDGYSVVALSKQNRSSGISATAAESGAYRDMIELIRVDFNKKFSAYLSSFL
ncbi:hypothetical protein S1OALGB6SA_1243 [Olavius algarvensis spirochete endosymbiont]|uniref:LPP20 family lipoprotein n=1 Tax=Olavius algarvensis spirochete endosymbiont TaxID=260710 RepID=UPI00052D0EF8|nr:LPP20 family lipoprotein [Olavius algarvensis spirochete endosymbiont]KGM38794.1 hypothetical protein JY97_14650 [Alkalispirochaeta odontotermitis]VDB00168.1 hypothetical protein S1OALGB6SA_1243 [Olavius algarvensis spirochete endosymbiont]